MSNIAAVKAANPAKGAQLEKIKLALDAVVPEAVDAESFLSKVETCVEKVDATLITGIKLTFTNSQS